MKYIITESQHKRLFEEEQKVLHIPDIKIFGNDWDILQRFLELRGNPPYSLGGNLNLRDTPIESIGNLTYVGGFLYLVGTPIKSLGKLTSVGGDLNLYETPIKSLGNLTSVGGDLYLQGTPIKSLGKLTSVGGDFYLRYTPMSEKYSKEEIRQMVNVGGKIFI